MSISQHQTAGGRLSRPAAENPRNVHRLRVAPAWVGGARPTADEHHLPLREAVWIWSVRRYCRVALWALPAGALLLGWSTLNVDTPPGPLAVRLAAGWLCTVAMIALAGLLAGSRTRRSALLGLLTGLAGLMVLLPLAALPAGVAPDGSPLPADGVRTASMIGAAVLGTGWLLLGWAVFRCKLVNPADGVLLMLAAVSIGAGSYASRPLPTVGALLLLAAGMGIAWTGNRLIPRA